MPISAIHFFAPSCDALAEGPDARAFLQGQTTNDLSRLQAGELSYGLLLDRRGKIVADAFFLCRGDERFEILSVNSPAETALGRLQAFLVMDEVELAARPSSRRGVAVWGGAAEVFARSLDLPTDPGGLVLERDGVLAFWARDEREPRVLAFAEEARFGALEEAAREAARASGGEALDEVGVARRAIAAGEPRVGREIPLGSDLPQECGLVERAVSFNKGCYLGQEVMARLRALGRTRKGFAVVALGGDDPVDAPSTLSDESGKRWGELRSVARVNGELRGLALLSVDAPRQLRLADGREARQIEQTERRE